MNLYVEEKFHNKNKKINFSLWKKLLKYASDFKKQLIILGFIMVAIAGIDVIIPYLTKYSVDNFVAKGNMKGLFKFSILYILVIIAQAINVKLLAILSGSVETKFAYHIRKIGFQKLQELSFSYYDKTSVGWIMSRMTSDIYRLSEIVSWGITDLIWAVFMMLGFAVVMFYHNWKLTLIILAVVPPLFLIGIYFEKNILYAYREVRKINSSITGDFNECIIGAETTKTLVIEEENLEEFKLHTRKMRDSSVRAAVFSSLFLPIVLTLGSVGTAFALWFGGKQVMLKNMSYGTLMMFISYSIDFFEPVSQLASTIAELQHAQASAERILSMIETESDIYDSKKVKDIYGDHYNPKRENWPKVQGNITFKNVSFSYKDGQKVLDNFSLDVKAGETIALVGETGSGKSTIVNLACRFYEPTEGEILIDGVNYKERSIAWLQSNLGYVLQTPYLFSGTIKENIRYGRLDATDEEIIEACKLVNAHEFIINMDNAYDTEVGEGGGMLSTGEKQLISFARAIVSNPSIFVLDEATSSIDTQTEKIIQKAIDKVLEGRTSFVIAHRLSTIVSADRILVIKNGKILEQGNHESLMKTKGYYYNLYTNQFVQEQETEILNQ